MPPLADDKLARDIHLRHAVVIAHGDLGKGAQNVKLRYRLGGCLDLRHLLGYRAAQVHEKVVFQLLYLVRSGQERRFKLFKLRGEVALV